MHKAPLQALAVAALLLSASAPAVRAAQPSAPPPAGSKYVAMGSSFAAGPGVTHSADAPPNRCGRSADNYAHQLARRHGLVLSDVSCSGATTANLLAPWRELPAQIDALDAATRLTTVTIGGNDVGYIGGLIIASCERLRTAATKACPPAQPAPPGGIDQAFATLDANLRALVAEVRRRAPNARLVFIDYPTVLPPTGTCAATPLSDAQADNARQLAQRLAALTARVAKDAGADLVTASRLTQGHDACAKDAWINGYPPANGVPYHPNLAGMTAVADAVEGVVWR